jgi:phage-related protein
MTEINEFRVSQIVDNGQVVQLSLLENVQSENISQKQMIKESVAKNLDSETQKQVMPLLDAILQAQPTIKIKSYQQTSITITMPKNRYQAIGKPQVGEILKIDLSKV